MFGSHPLRLTRERVTILECGSVPSNNRLKLTRGEGGSHSSGAPSRASRARSFLSRRAQLNAVLSGPQGTGGE